MVYLGCTRNNARKEVGKTAVNIDKLNGKIVENRMTKEDFARAIGINPSTLFRKTETGGDSFSVGEMHRAVEVLQLDASEAVSIFLPQYSQKCENKG